jgi:hypothetical protein
MVASVHLHCWLKALADFSQAENLLGEAKETLSQITEKTSQAICSFQKGLVALKVDYLKPYYLLLITAIRTNYTTF